MSGMRSGENNVIEKIIPKKFKLFEPYYTKKYNDGDANLIDIYNQMLTFSKLKPNNKPLVYILILHKNKGFEEMQYEDIDTAYMYAKKRGELFVHGEQKNINGVNFGFFIVKADDSLEKEEEIMEEDEEKTELKPGKKGKEDDDEEGKDDEKKGGSGKKDEEKKGGPEKKEGGPEKYEVKSDDNLRIKYIKNNMDKPWAKTRYYLSKLYNGYMDYINKGVTKSHPKIYIAIYNEIMLTLGFLLLKVDTSEYEKQLISAKINNMVSGKTFFDFLKKNINIDLVNRVTPLLSATIAETIRDILYNVIMTLNCKIISKFLNDFLDNFTKTHNNHMPYGTFLKIAACIILYSTDKDLNTFIKEKKYNNDFMYSNLSFPISKNSTNEDVEKYTTFTIDIINDILPKYMIQ